MRDIKFHIETGAFTGPSFGVSEYKDSSGKANTMFVLDFEATMIVVTGYDVNRRAADQARGNKTPRRAIWEASSG